MPNINRYFELKGEDGKTTKVTLELFIDRWKIMTLKDPNYVWVPHSEIRAFLSKITEDLVFIDKVADDREKGD